MVGEKIIMTPHRDIILKTNMFVGAFGVLVYWDKPTQKNKKEKTKQNKIKNFILSWGMLLCYFPFPIMGGIAHNWGGLLICFSPVARRSNTRLAFRQHIMWASIIVTSFHIRPPPGAGSCRGPGRSSPATHSTACGLRPGIINRQVKLSKNKKIRNGKHSAKKNGDG